MNISVRHYAVGILALFALACASTAFAQERQGLEFRPAIIQATVNPGTSYNYSVNFTNISDVALTYSVNAVDITGIDNSNTPIFAQDGQRTPYDLSQWITLPVTSVTLQPHESKDIAFTVAIPKDAAPGSHFASILLNSNPDKLRANGSSVGVESGPIVSLRIAGEANEDAQLREFSSSHIIYGTPSDVSFTVKVANIGNTLVRPRGIIEISDMRGAKVDVLKVNDDASGVFPGADKTFVQKWTSYDGFAIGRYQALVSMTYGEDSKKTISAVTSFWVLPLKPVLTLLAIVFGGLLFLYLVVRLYISRKIREMGGGRGGADLYRRRNQSPVPGLLTIALAIVFVAIIFLVLLFLMFA